MGSMDRSTYLKRFSRQLRWRLPAWEADVVLSDYAELLGERPPEWDAGIIEDLGTPYAAAKMLTRPVSYLGWLAAFAGMSLCLLCPLILLLRGGPFPAFPAPVFLALGMGLSLLFFHPTPSSVRRPIPRGLLLSLLGILFLFAAVALVLGSLISGAWTQLPPPLYGVTARWTLSLGGTAAAILGFFGLVQARISDRRWSALYLMGLTAAVVCVMVLAALTSLDTPSTPDWWVSPALTWGISTGFGLAGAGVSLC